MSRAVVLGKRADGTLGVFVAPPGVDAYTASDSQLLLNISSKISQLLMLSYVTGSQSVVLGLSRRPYVMLTSHQTMSGVPGFGFMEGPVRPAPVGLYGASSASSYADIAADGSSMYVTCSNKTSFAVFNEALP